MTHRFSFFMTLALALITFTVPSAFAEAPAKIKVEQLSASTYGSWTLLSQNGNSRTSKDPEADATGGYIAETTEFGQTTLSVTTPAGMTALISVYRHDQLVTNVTSQQHSFPLIAGDNYRFIISYTLARTGSLGITSEPTKLRFRMKGASGKTYHEMTPFTFINLPAGKYSLFFPKTDNCLQPAVQTVAIKEDERNTTKVTLTCNVREREKVDRTRLSKRAIREYAQSRETKTRGNRK